MRSILLSAFALCLVFAGSASAAETGAATTAHKTAKKHTIRASSSKVGAASAEAAVPSSSAWLNPFVGFSAAPNSLHGEFGAVAALSEGHNLEQDGFLLRANGFVGSYSYKHLVGATTQTQDVTYKGLAVMPGYHFNIDNRKGLVSLYGGVEVQDHPNSDGSAAIRGTRVGGKVLGEISYDFCPEAYGLVSGSYSTAWNSYFTFAKTGYRFTPKISAGPEFAALGNDRFSAVRAGAFASTNVFNSAELIGSVGYNFDTHQDPVGNDDGAYGTVHLRWLQ